MKRYLAAAILACCVAANAKAQTVTDDFIFQFGSQEMNPSGNLAEQNGIFYGRALYGLFSLTPPSGTTTDWTYTALGGPGVTTAPAQGPTIDPQGNLYLNDNNGSNLQSGNIVELSPPARAGRQWTQKILAALPSTVDARSYGSLYRDSKGVLYGTTEGWINNGVGVVYSLAPPAAGQTAWTFTVLHQFGSPPDGGTPLGSVIGLPDGTLIGTTAAGGPAVHGTVFALSPPSVAGGAWVEHILYSFHANTDGYFPTCTLAVDAADNIYGTTQRGGPDGDGTIFELSPPPSHKGAFTFKLLAASGGATDYGVTLGANGKIFGVAYGGEINVLTPNPSSPGNYTVTMLPAPGPDAGSSLLKVGSYLYGVDQFGPDQTEGVFYDLPD